MRLKILAFLLIVFAGANATVSVQQVDPFLKVLPNSNPDVFSIIQSVAHGERLAIQLLLKNDINDKFTLGLNSSTLPSATIAGIKKYRIGYIKVTPRIGRPASDQLKSSDQTYPDPLFAQDTFSVTKNEALPILLDIPVGAGIKPGMHTIKVSVISASKKDIASVSISFQVFNVTVPANKMNYITWYHDADYRLMNNGSPVAPFSDLYWKIFKNIVRAAKENGQNTFTINQLFLIKYLKTPDNKWSADYSEFDRAVDIILKEVGMQYVNCRQFAARLGGWEAPFGLTFPKFYGPRYFMNNRALGDAEAMDFYNWFIPDYYKHLKAKNILNKTLQHIADEPIGANKSSFIAIAKYIKGLAPDLTTIEAIQTMDVAPYIDIPVILLDQLPGAYPAIQKMQQNSKKAWFYTCNSPQGEYANRFIELPLLKTTLLPWIASKYHLDGYLHWALDFWGDAPYEDGSVVKFGPSQMTFPGGDAWLFYPAYQSVNISIRSLAMRNGITDVALLNLLRKQRPADAERINNDLVQNFDKYDLNTADYFQKKKEILTLLASTNKSF
jgi:hypothetical protein